MQYKPATGEKGRSPVRCPFTATGRPVRRLETGSHLGLSNAVRAIHGLQVLHGVPVVLEENHRVGAGQVEAETAHARRQEENVDRGILSRGQGVGQQTN